LCSIIPSLVVHPLSKDFNWWLCTILFLLWHVQIINEDDESLTCWWAINTFSSFFDFRINCILCLIFSSLGWKC
jgi:hypothetical protein